jgi:hypothetical protein
MEYDMAEVVSDSKVPSPFDDPFLADFEDFIATFCGTGLSIPSASCCVTHEAAESFHEALAVNTSTATVVQTSAALAIKAPEGTSFHGDYRTSGRLTRADAVAIFKMKRRKTSKTAARLAAKYSITPKAVRDVWTWKTWIVATKSLWTCKDVCCP